MNRTLQPELLDHLDPADPGAIRSRRDLRFLDLFLGNSRWTVRSLRRFQGRFKSFVELGAGDGRLCRALSDTHPSAEITGLDRVGRPVDLCPSIRWVSGDFLETLPAVNAEVCFGSLILHHLDAPSLRRLGHEFRRFPLLLFTEPYRGTLPLRMAGLALPFVGEITRHDMPASIRAGFRKGELAPLLGLDPARWEVRELVTRRGSLRFAAIRT
jgi:hypothetical protein